MTRGSRDETDMWGGIKGQRPAHTCGARFNRQLEQDKTSRLHWSNIELEELS